MNTGKYVFAQDIEFLQRYKFDKLVKNYNGDFYIRDQRC